jgi:hypothetical protein
VNLEAVQNVHDVAKAAEFARLVNFIPRQGQTADTFSDAAILWRVHRDILVQMDFATETLTSAEQAQYQAARNTLYTTDAAGVTMPSPKLLLYEEMQSTYQDLVQSGGSPEMLTLALSNWMVLGHKQAIEDALEIIGRLARRSSRTQAEKEALLLNETPPGVGLRFHGDMEFAPTYFAPLSAISRTTWMEAKTTFADLDRAVGSPPNAKWTAYLANREGEVAFDYAVIHCIRPWYTPALYQADDWRLTGGSEMVSKGNGAEGQLPAYVEAVYLVVVKDVTIKPKPAPTPPPETRPKPPFHTIDPFPLGPIRTQPLMRAQPTLRPKSLGGATPKEGVVSKGVNTPMALRSNALAINALSAPQRNGGQTLTLADREFTVLNTGRVRPLTPALLHHRVAVTEAVLLQNTPPAPPTPEPPPVSVYVAGFGCRKIPLAPNPNINYHWE